MRQDAPVRLFHRYAACIFLAFVRVKGCPHPWNYVIGSFVRTGHPFKLHIAECAESPERRDAGYLEFALLVAHCVIQASHQ
jgi:hypothetical protein